MNKAIIRDLMIILLVAGAIVGFYFLFFSDTDKKVKPDSKNFIAVEKEKKVGDIITEFMLKSPEYKELKHPLIDSAVNVIFERLHKNLEHSEFQYNIRVFDNAMVNGFALPGGNMLLSTGLIEFAETPEEIAAVIAHEMGHVENRHLLGRLSKEIVILILTGGNSTYIGEASRMVASTAFDRKQEKEADDFALRLLEKTKIHPVVLATLFRRMKEEQGSFNKHLEIISTHPHHDDRIKAAMEYKVADDFENKPIPLDWEKIRNYQEY